MKYFFGLILMFIGNESFSQKKDTITVELSFSKRIEHVKKDLTKRYNYTKTVGNSEECRRDKDTFGCKFITDYKLEELSVKIIPQYELSKKFKFQGNVMNFINFNTSKRTTVYTVNDKNNNFLDFEFDTELWDDLELAFIFDCDLALPFDSNILTMMKLRLHEKYFAFKLDNLSQVLFIVDEGIVYAITNPLLDGTYQKTEINKFFAENVGFGGVEYITDSDEEQYRKSNKGHHYKFSPSKEIYKVPYFFNVKSMD